MLKETLCFLMPQGWQTKIIPKSCVHTLGSYFRYPTLDISGFEHSAPLGVQELVLNRISCSIVKERILYNDEWQITANFVKNANALGLEDSDLEPDKEFNFISLVNFYQPLNVLNALTLFWLYKANMNSFRSTKVLVELLPFLFIHTPNLSLERFQEFSHLGYNRHKGRELWLSVSLWWDLNHYLYQFPALRDTFHSLKIS